MDIMDKRLNTNQQLMRERATYDYLKSLDNGDIDGIIAALEQAVYDAPLDQMLVGADEAYFQEEQTQSKILAETPTRTDLHTLQPRPMYTQPQRRRQRGSPWWMRVLAAILLFSVLVGGFLALLAWRQGANTAAPTLSPPTAPCTTFKSYPAPSVGQGNIGQITAITTVGPDYAWAVGDYTPLATGPHPGTTLIEHWDGQRWQIVPSPNGPAGNGILSAVAAVSANDAWAAGSYFTPEGGGGSRTLIEHWDGSAWKVVASPNNFPYGAELNALAAVSANDVWAAGFVGTSSVDGNQRVPLIEHWDGKQWSRVTDFPTGNQPVSLDEVAAVSAQDIWVAGRILSRGGPESQGILAHWDGSQWQLFGNFAKVDVFTELSVVAQNDVWALGTIGLTSAQVMEHWDGQKWNTVTLPALAPAGTNAELADLVAVSTQEVWLLGVSWVNTLEKQLIIFHGDGKTWQPVKIQVSQVQAFSAIDAIGVGHNQTWIMGGLKDGALQILGCS